MSKKPKCPKCGYFGGDDWSQCDGSCPMPMSPHRTELLIEVRDAVISRIDQKGD